MTAQTITVPVSAIEALYKGADGLGAFGSTYLAVQALRAFLPEPPKVGDTVVSAEGLPAGTVLRDNTDDLWLVGPDESLSYVVPSVKAPKVWPIIAPSWEQYQPVIIALPRD